MSEVRTWASRALGIALLTASLAAVGCGSDGGGDDGSSADALGSSPAKAGQVKAGALDGEQLTFVGFGGDPQKIQMDILSRFAEESGAELVDDSPSDYAKIKAQVESGNVTWDVVNVDSVWAAGHCDLLVKPDPKLINTAKLPAGIKTGPCGVPGDITGNVLAYDKAAAGDDPPTGWADFFDTEKYPGKRAVDGNSPIVVMEIALLADGVPPDELYPIDVDRALKKLDTIRDDLVFWTSGAQQQQMMESGQVAMGVMWSGRVYYALQAGADWGVAHQQPLLTTSMWVIPKGARDPAAAMAMINYWQGAEQSAEFTEGTSYPGPNGDAKPDLDPAAQKVQITEEPFADQLTVNDQFWSENLDRITDTWVNWTSG